jgi:hypothetical protein
VNPAAKTEMVLPLAAFFPLAEKPHLGHPLPTAILYPGITLAISNTASGLRVCLYDSGRRSRSTSILRDDDETASQSWTERFTYQYDDFGNWIQRTTETVSHTGEVRRSMIERRELTYY